MNLGFGEMIFIFVLALIIFGPKKMPEIGRQIGRALAEFRRASNEFRAQIETEINQLELDKDVNTIAPTTSVPPDDALGHHDFGAPEHTISGDAPSLKSESPQQESSLGVDDSPEHRLLKVNESRNVRSARVQRALNHPNRALAALREGVRVALPRRVRDRMIHSVATVNIRTVPRSPMSPELRGELTDFFSDDVLELENVIGRDLSAWRTPER